VFCGAFIDETVAENAFQTAWDLGNYYHLEHAPLYNTTLAFAVMSSKYTYESIEEFDAKMERLLTLSANIVKTNSIPPREPAICIDFAAMKEYLDRVEKEVSEAALACADGELIRREMENGLRMVRHGIHLY
ncbi:glycosyl hydrolase family 20, partial [Hungatella sp. SL.1.14]|nr:glycosyl hydrolase family 20 [Hungatella sp. SL.1.14]